MSGFQKGAIYGEIKEYVQEKFGLKISSLYISPVKRKYRLEVGPNYNRPKSKDQKVPQCPQRKKRRL